MGTRSLTASIPSASISVAPGMLVDPRPRPVEPRRPTSAALAEMVYVFQAVRTRILAHPTHGFHPFRRCVNASRSNTRIMSDRVRCSTLANRSTSTSPSGLSRTFTFSRGDLSGIAVLVGDAEPLPVQASLVGAVAQMLRPAVGFSGLATPTTYPTQPDIRKPRTVPSILFVHVGQATTIGHSVAQWTTWHSQRREEPH